MRTRRALATLVLLATTACGASRASTGATPHADEAPPPVASTAPPRSLDAALVANGLVRVEPALIDRHHSGLETGGPRVEGRRVTLNVSAGWNQESPVFARRGADEIVLVESRPTTVVDRHVDGGCRDFYGGRAWFETVVYELPEGTRYGGVATVAWENHVETVDYREVQADGSPCPPPALD